MIFLVYCIVSLFYYVSVLSPGPVRDSLWHDSVFVLKVPLNTKQASKQTNKQTCVFSENKDFFLQIYTATDQFYSMSMMHHVLYGRCLKKW